MIGAPAGGVPGGVLGAVLATLRKPAPPPPPEPVVKQQPPTTPKSIRVSSDVQKARLIRRVDPVYPALARQARIQGTVRLQAVISQDGRIERLETISGHPLLIPAAVQAVSQWLYRPTLLGGSPVEVITQVDVIFRLN